VTSNYGYDAIYELTSVLQGANTTESYTYDPVGNRLSSLSVSPYSYNASNELTSTPNATYGYDLNGNAVTKNDSTGITTYAWDFENRLTSVTLPAGGGTVTFAYDPFGRRIEKASSAGTSIYAYDGSNLVEETNASGALVARYAQGLNIDQPLATLRSGTTSYYQADGLDSITSLSNTAGAIAGNYTYDSFGNLVATSGSIVNNFRYTGREFDTETNLYYYRVRYYDPATGRFLSGDPLGFFPGVNFYAYANNSPISLFDPWGLCPCSSSSSTPQKHPFPPITGGVSVGASAEAGLGSLGGTAMSGNLGFGESGSHMGIVASGGIGMNAGNYAGGSPAQNVKTTGVYGAYVGAGQSFFISNGQPCDLQGPFKTFNFEFGIGVLAGSVSLAVDDNGVYQITVGNPFASKGVGLAVSAYTTNTKVSPCCN